MKIKAHMTLEEAMAQEKVAVISDWNVRLRRITEEPGYVFMELTEFGSYKGLVPDDSIYSLSVYEFNEKSKLRHLDVYMQRENVPIAPGSWDLRAS